MYEIRGGAWEVNTRACRRKVLLRATVGELRAETDWHGEASNRMIARFTPDKGEAWEGALDYFDSTWVPRNPRPFDVCTEEVRADFASFLEALPAAPDEFAAAKRRAAYVNWSAIVSPSGAVPASGHADEQKLYVECLELGPRLQCHGSYGGRSRSCMGPNASHGGSTK